MATAAMLHDAEDYAYSIYTAGLAVECILRAYRTAADPHFDSRHSIDRLYQASRFAARVSPGRSSEMASAIWLVAMIWRNEHRFRSQTTLRRHVKKQGLDRGLKGDALKELSRRTVNDATLVVTHGASRYGRTAG